MSIDKKEFLRKGLMCTLVYEHSEWVADTEIESETHLQRCIPDDGVFLYEIKATYAKQIPPTTYYYLGKSVKHAKERFSNVMSWMKITDIRLIPPGEEAQRILTNPNTIP